MTSPTTTNSAGSQVKRPFRIGDILQSRATGKYVVVTGVTESGFTWAYVENMAAKQGWEAATVLFSKTN